MQCKKWTAVRTKIAKGPYLARGWKLPMSDLHYSEINDCDICLKLQGME